MKFSDIQKNPLDYDKDVLGGKIEAYFTVTLKDCLFIDQLTTHKLDITLTEETTEPCGMNTLHFQLIFFRRLCVELHPMKTSTTKFVTLLRATCSKRKSVVQLKN